MDLELLFKFLVLFAQICAVYMVGAFIADHIVQPKVERRRK